MAQAEIQAICDRLQVRVTVDRGTGEAKLAAVGGDDSYHSIGDIYPAKREPEVAEPTEQDDFDVEPAKPKTNLYNWALVIVSLAFASAPLKALVQYWGVL